MTSTTTGHGEIRPLRRDAELNRRRILEAAAEVFAERGVGASLDDVAHRAGLGVGTVYRRFANKEELVDALFEDRFEQVGAMMEEALTYPDSWQAVVTFFEHMAELIMRDRGLGELMASSTYGRTKVAESRKRMEPLADRLFGRARADGHLRADFDSTDVQVLIVMIGAAVDYCAPVRPDAWRRHVAYILDGMRARDDTTPLSAPPLTTDEADTIMQNWRPPPRR